MREEGQDGQIPRAIKLLICSLYFSGAALLIGVTSLLFGYGILYAMCPSGDCLFFFLTGSVL